MPGERPSGSPGPIEPWIDPATENDRSKLGGLLKHLESWETHEADVERTLRKLSDEADATQDSNARRRYERQRRFSNQAWRATAQSRRSIPGYGRLEALINEEWGTPVTARAVRLIRGRICRMLGRGAEEVDELSVLQVVEHLEPGQPQIDRVDESGSPPVKRTDATPFMTLGQLITGVDAFESSLELCRRSHEDLRRRMMGGGTGTDRIWAMSAFNDQGSIIAASEYQHRQRLMATPGAERLLVYCNRVWGEDLTARCLRRIRGQIGVGAEALTVEEAADALDRSNPQGGIDDSTAQGVGGRSNVDRSEGEKNAPPAEQVPGEATSKPRRRRIPQKETDHLVREYFKDRPSPKSITEIVEATGSSRGAIAKSPTWRAYMETRSSDTGQPKPKERPLTDSILACRPGPDMDPHETVAEIEILQRRYLESATPDEKGEYLGMSEEDKRGTLFLWMRRRSARSEPEV